MDQYEMHLAAREDAIRAEAARERRSAYHVTLGELIETLCDASPHAVVEIEGPGAEGHKKHPGWLRAYRGYAGDLAIEPTERRVTAADLLAAARDALDAEMRDHQGAVHVASAWTPLWVAEKGLASGAAVIQLAPARGVLIMRTRSIAPPE